MSEGSSGSALSFAGVALAIGGIVCAVIAWNMITEVAPPPRTAEEVLAGVRATGAVSNIGLMQDQMMTLYSGLAAIISGFMLIAAGAVVKAIETRKE